MYNFQSLLGTNPTIIAMGQLGPISSDVTKMVNPEKYIKPKEKTKSELVLDPTTGRMVAKDRVTGFWRPGAGMLDWLSGNQWDLDKRGDGTGTAHHETGAGGIHKDYEVGIGGEMKKKEIPDTRSDFEKATDMTMKDWMKENEAMQLRIGKKKFEQEQMARMPDLMHAAFGGSYATAAAPGNANLAQIAAASRPYQFNSPAIRSSSINFASLLR